MTDPACSAIAATTSRVGVAGRRDRDAGSEVEEQVAVDVLDGQTLGADGNDRIGARQAG